MTLVEAGTNLALIMIGGGIFALVVIATTVVVLFPNDGDPRRNQRRYTAPAMVAVTVALLGIVLFLVMLAAQAAA
jgi:hypothetical protein